MSHAELEEGVYSYNLKTIYEKYGLKRGHIYKLIAEGRLHASKIGRTILIKKEEILKLINDNEVVIKTDISQ